ncbi:MAG: hypothetical protein IJV56_00790, partial [Neisseriaceae bacterium]|nr:hypothetical protein [Neisseriaceae bacterium]
NAVENNSTVGQAQFATRHPKIAIEIGQYKDPTQETKPNISTIAGTFQINIFNELKDEYSDINREGGEANAFRHTFWQAMIANKFGDEIAVKVGNAHESYWGTDFSQRQNLSQTHADEICDQMNNIVGRTIAAKNPNSSNKKLAELSLDYYHKYGLYQAVKNEQGTYDVKVVKMTGFAYEKSKTKLQTLDNTGAGEKLQQIRKEKLQAEAKSK